MLLLYFYTFTASQLFNMWSYPNEMKYIISTDHRKMNLLTYKKYRCKTKKEKKKFVIQTIILST